MKINKFLYKGFSYSLIVSSLFTSFYSPVLASESAMQINTSSTHNMGEQSFQVLVSEGYLIVDKEHETVKISEKYKQEVLSSVDATQYDVLFTENSVTLSPKYSSRAFTGVNTIVYTWKGVDIYLDNTRANQLGAALVIGSGAAAVAAGGSALVGLVPASAVAGIISGVLAMGSGIVYFNNAAGRGIIIACLGELPHITPHWIASQ